MSLEGIKPVLTPTELHPSPDAPEREHLIHHTASGRTLIVASDEHYLLSAMDGSDVRGIACRIWRQGVAPLTTLGRLLRYLDRFEFLQSGSLPLIDAGTRMRRFVHHGTAEPTDVRDQVNLTPGFREAIGRVASTPLFIAVTVMLIAAVCCVWSFHSHDVSVLLVGSSPALGILILLASLFVSIWMGTWIQAQAVAAYTCTRAVLHPEARLGVPFPWLDLSPTLTLPQAIRMRIVFSAPLAMIFLSSVLFLICWFLPLKNAPDVGLQLLVGTVVAMLMYSSPWWESSWAYLAMIYLRHADPLRLGVDAIRTLVFAFFRSQPPEGGHHPFLLGWGAWALFWPILIVRLISALFRRDLPLLINMLGEESGTLAWWGLLILAIAIALGVLTVVGITFGLFLYGIVESLRRRWWPEYYLPIAFVGFVVLSAVMWKLDAPHQVNASFISPCCSFLLGVGLLVGVWRCMRRDFWGMDGLPFILLGLVGVSHGIEAFGMSMHFRLAVWALCGLGLLVSLISRGSALFIYFWRSHDALAVLWLIIAGFLDVASHRLLADPSWPAISIYWQHVSVIAAMTGLMSRAGSRGFQLNRFESGENSDSVARLQHELQQLTGRHEAVIDGSLDWSQINPRMDRMIGPDTWSVVVKRWLSHVALHEAIRCLMTSSRWEMFQDKEGLESNQIGEALRQIPCLREADPNRIGDAARLLVADTGDVVIRQGMKDDALYLLHQGEVAIEMNEGWIGTTTVARLDAGTFVGEIGFLTGRERTATVRAVRPLVAIMLRPVDVQVVLPEFISRLAERSTDHFWTGLLQGLPVFREMSESLFLRTVLQGKALRLSPGQRLEFATEEEIPVIAVLQGEIELEGHDLPAGTLLGIDRLWSDDRIAPELTARQESLLIALPRRLMQEAVEEIILDAELA